MIRSQPVPATPLRILFVLASLEDGDEGVQIARLASQLDPAAYRIEVLSCFGPVTGGLHRQAALATAGVASDITPHALSLDETVSYLSHQVVRHDIVVSAQNVADIYPALDRLHLHPPLIEWGRTPEDACAGPKHRTRAYVARTEETRRAAAARLPHGPESAVCIAPMLHPAAEGALNGALGALLRAGARAPADVARAWRQLFDRLAQERHPAPPPDLFRSFWQGGFECSTHRLRSGRRLDVISEFGHDRATEADYRQLAGFGMRTLRDGLRWHLIEPSPGAYDFSSFTPMLQAAGRSGTQVIWDLFHYGWPDDLDIWSPAFVTRFARFAAAAARHHRDHSDEIPMWCPVNEISFMAWGGGDVGYLNPFGTGRGFEMKVQLARAAIAAMEELRAVDPRARFVHCEPAIAIHHLPGGPYSRAEAEAINEQQFQAFDLLSGRIWPQIGGRPEFLDVLGLNYYVHNQWFHGGGNIDVGDPRYRPLSDILFDTHARYGRPVTITETGIEGDRRASWLTYVAGEAMRARDRGVPVQGLCLYPVANHPGWDDGRLCPNGLLGHEPGPDGREVDAPLAEALLRLQRQPPLHGELRLVSAR